MQLEEHTWLDLIFRASPESHDFEKTNFLSNLLSKQFFNTHSQLNYVVRKTKKSWVRKPYFILETLSKDKYLIQRDLEKMVLKITNGSQRLRHEGLKVPEIQGQDGVIVDLEKKTAR